MSERIEVCRERPERLRGAPIGQYHCPECGCMVLAGIPHLPHDWGCGYGGRPDPVWDGPAPVLSGQPEADQ